MTWATVDIPPDPGVGCTESWQEAGHAWTVRCDWDDYDQLYDCECFEDSVSESHFDSLDFCQVQTPAQMTQANAGCTWGVGLSEPCGQNWTMDNVNYGVGCTGTTTGWECACYDTYPEVVFQADALCNLRLGPDPLTPDRQISIIGPRLGPAPGWRARPSTPSTPSSLRAR